jgi:hypothetical protein
LKGSPITGSIFQLNPFINLFVGRITHHILFGLCQEETTSKQPDYPDNMEIHPNPVENASSQKHSGNSSAVFGNSMCFVFGVNIHGQQGRHTGNPCLKRILTTRSLRKGGKTKGGDR